MFKCIELFIHIAISVLCLLQKNGQRSIKITQKIILKYEAFRNYSEQY